MVRHIHVTVDDKEYDALEKQKGDKSWLEFILQLKK